MAVRWSQARKASLTGLAVMAGLYWSLPTPSVRAEDIRSIHFPVAVPVQFHDDFGDPRDGGTRTHKGNDVFAPKLAPLLSPVTGTVITVGVESGISGNYLKIQDAAGWDYLLIHMNNDTPGTDDNANPAAWRFAPGIGLGSNVAFGQHVGWVGDSGNAEGEAPHVHFEIRTPADISIDPWFSLVRATNIPAGSFCDLDSNPAPFPSADSGPGYWQAKADGAVYGFGSVPFYGSLVGTALNHPIVGMAAAPDGLGYWLVAADGGVFSFGSAPFFGSTGGMDLNEPVVGMAAAPDGLGYWLVAADGGVFSFGSAPFFGSTGGLDLNQPVVGVTPRLSADGYWLLAADGGVFTFGAAGYHGSVPGSGSCGPLLAVSLVASDSDFGYWVGSGDGRVWPFGDAFDYDDAYQSALPGPITAFAAP